MTQISAIVSEDTAHWLEQATRKRGLKKGFVIESALRHHLMAISVIPEEFLVSPSVTLTMAGWEHLEKLMADESEPAEALRALMRNG